MPDFEGSPEHVWTLAEIWDVADKIYTWQPRESNITKDDLPKGPMCAIEVIYFVLRSEYPKPEAIDEGHRLLMLWNEKNKVPIHILNDEQGWDFRKFSDRAKELGI